MLCRRRCGSAVRTKRSDHFKRDLPDYKTLPQKISIDAIEAQGTHVVTEDGDLKRL